MTRALFLGDSLLGGYFASVSDNRFRTLAVAELGDVEVFSGSTAGGTTKVVSVTDFPGGVDLAVIELGTNDSLKTWPGMFRRQYRDLLARVRESSPNARVVALGLWRPTWRAWAWDRVIEDEVARVGGTFVRLSDAYGDPATRGPAGRSTWLGEADDFHPNDLGHRVIADRLIEALRKVGVLAA